MKRRPAPRASRKQVSSRDARGEPAAGSLPDSLTQSPGFMLGWVAAVATRDYEQALAGLGISPSHLGILTLLESRGAMVQAHIGDQLSIVKPAIVGLVNELEAMRLVERRAHPTDGRAFAVHLLPAGMQRIRQAKSVSESATAAFFEVLTPSEQRAFHRMLSRLAASHQQRVDPNKDEAVP